MRPRRSNGAAPRAAAPPQWKRLGELDEYRALSKARLRYVIEVGEPLVLVSQIQRSGGTLLGQLFDGHPECHAHPHELKIGYPRKDTWPLLDLSRPETWFETLFERRLTKQFRRGFQKRGKGDDFDVFPFLFLIRLQKEIFDACVRARRIGSERDVLDCYFTSYFNAWLDNHNLFAGPKKVVTGFTPRLAMEPANVQRFFSVYPDGLLISLVRDPRGWYLSASSHAPHEYGDVDAAIAMWRRSAEAALAARERHGDRVLVLTYEQLVRETEATMRNIAERIGISMSPVLLAPTFNGRPIRANSSDAVRQHGVLPWRADAYRDALGRETIARIEQLAGGLYERAAALAP